MKAHQQFKNRLIAAYVISTLLLFIGGGILFKIQLDASTQNFKIIAEKDLRISALASKHIFLNAFKLLDVTNRDLHQLIISKNYQDRAIKETLANAASVFSMDSQIENYGLLLLIDKDGNLLSISDGAPTTGLNFKDRFYFQDLRNHPNKTFTIGPLILATTTKKGIFHIAVPLRGAQNQFFGALVLQINEKSISESIEFMTGLNDRFITAVTSEDEVIFSTVPSRIQPNSNTAINFSDFYSNAELSEEFLVAQYESPILGIKFISTQSNSSILKAVINQNIKALWGFLISYVIFSYLMWLIYCQFMSAEKERLLSSTDQLTQLPNRRAFDRQYEQLVRESKRSHSDISALFIDIDKFKNCNDTYGHENGDRVLRSLASIIQSSVRRPLDFCCRWGGEELVVLLPNTNQQGAETVAEKILNAVRNATFSLSGFPPIKITVSIGIATENHQLVHTGDENLVDRADQAMYRAKQAGRDRYST
jgi:diguanylate cyclase (GGDEF)-like protein